VSARDSIANPTGAIVAPYRHPGTVATSTTANAARSEDGQASTHPRHVERPGHAGVVVADRGISPDFGVAAGLAPALPASGHTAASRCGRASRRRQSLHDTANIGTACPTQHKSPERGSRHCGRLHRSGRSCAVTAREKAAGRTRLWPCRDVLLGAVHGQGRAPRDRQPLGGG
jgi:hypothetical protein